VSFADLEARTSEAVMRQLSNAIATPLVGPAVTVIFDRAHIDALGIDVSATHPVAQAASADVAGWVPHSTQLAINGVDYMLRDTHPDGTGLTLLMLEVI
jgi:hypothetical protein